MQRIALLILLFLSFFVNGKSQYKSFKLNADRDTLNIVDNKGLKQGKWITSVPEIREEPGYDEEGIYKDDKKEGIWKRYTTMGDIIAIENYRFGGKDGVQKYFTFLGQPEREEQWHSYDPKSPYDTIPVYGVGNDEIVKYNIVKAVQYSVPDGEWTYYDPNTGAVTKVDKYNRGLLLKDNADATQSTSSTIKNRASSNPSDSTKSTTVKEKQKPQEVLDYEKKYSKKKKKALEVTGQTGL